MEASARRERRESAARTLAQSFCLLVGVTLIAVGVLGFIFGGSGFGAGSDVQGEDFIIFEVNGWHNIVHLATGAFLLAMAPKAASAAFGATIFGLLYVVVTIWGFISGDSVLWLVPVDAADNILHLALALAGLGAAAASGGLAFSSRRSATA